MSSVQTTNTKKPFTTETQRHREKQNLFYGFLCVSVVNGFGFFPSVLCVGGGSGFPMSQTIVGYAYAREFGVFLFYGFLCVSVSLWLMVFFDFLWFEQRNLG
jgi:hypothetical protein